MEGDWVTCREEEIREDAMRYQVTEFGEDGTNVRHATDCLILVVFV